MDELSAASTVSAPPAVTSEASTPARTALPTSFVATDAPSETATPTPPLTATLRAATTAFERIVEPSVASIVASPAPVGEAAGRDERLGGHPEVVDRDRAAERDGARGGVGARDGDRDADRGRRDRGRGRGGDADVAGVR